MSSDPPPLSSIQPMTPPALDRAVKKCLRKDPDERWQNVRDVTDELKWIAEGGSQRMSTPTTAVRGIRALGRRELVLSAGALLLVAALSGLSFWSLKPTPPQPVTRTVINLSPGQQLAGLDRGPALALSPNGNLLAYVARTGGTQQIYLRAMDSLEARPIPGTEGGLSPFFSPDGQWLGFFAGNKLKKVSVSGGAAQTLADAPEPRGAAWGSRGVIAFAPAYGSALQQVSDAGGTPQPLTHFEKGETSHSWPEFLPGGKAVLFAAGALGNSSFDISVQSVMTGERQNLVQGATLPRYAPSGHLVYAQGGGLMAVPFDPKQLMVKGAAVPVLEGILQYSISATGSLVYVPGGVQSAQSRLVWVSRNGTEQPLAAPAHGYRNPRVSPDGRQVSVDIQEQGRQVWLYDLSRETLTRLTFEGSADGTPAWTPDGKRIVFQSNKEGSALNLFWLLADGSGGLERLTTSENGQAPSSWSPDGQLLAFTELNPSTGWDIWVLRLGDPSAGSGRSRKAQPFLQTQFTEGAPRFSPDGNWLAYVSNESGRYEIYVQPYPGPGGKRQISADGGTEPVWNRNGRELFYRTGNKMMAVDIATLPSFAAGKPRMLFEGSYLPTAATIQNYDVSPDGQRFLMLKGGEREAEPTQINVVLNWFEELKRRVPSGTK